MKNFFFQQLISQFFVHFGSFPNISNDIIDFGKKEMKFFVYVNEWQKEKCLGTKTEQFKMKNDKS